MKSFSATDAKNRFGELIDMAQAQPVRVQRQGRDVAIVMSPEEFRRLSEAASGRVNPAVQHLHSTSVARWAKVYEALAKQVGYLSLYDALYVHSEQLRLFGTRLEATPEG